MYARPDVLVEFASCPPALDPGCAPDPRRKDRAYVTTDWNTGVEHHPSAGIHVAPAIVGIASRNFGTPGTLLTLLGRLPALLAVMIVGHYSNRLRFCLLRVRDRIGAVRS